MRRDVRHARGEEVRPLLFHQRGALPFALGLFELGTCLLLLAHLRDDRAVADAKLHGVDSGTVGKRERVVSVDAGIEGVLEPLRDDCVQQRPGDIELGTHLDQGKLDRATIRRAAQRAGRFIVTLRPHRRAAQ